MRQRDADIPRPTAEEISRIWQRAHDRQAETGRDQWVIGSAQQTDRRLHLRAGEDETLCGGHSGDMDNLDSKAAAVFPEGYHDLCLHCVARWRADQ